MMIELKIEPPKRAEVQKLFRGSMEWQLDKRSIAILDNEWVVGRRSSHYYRQGKGLLYYHIHYNVNCTYNSKKATTTLSVHPANLAKKRIVCANMNCYRWVQDKGLTMVEILRRSKL